MTLSEIETLRLHELWLLQDVIPGFIAPATEKTAEHVDWQSIDKVLEQLFDIQYQIKLMDRTERKNRAKVSKQFNVAFRRVEQTYEPYTEGGVDPTEDETGDDSD